MREKNIQAEFGKRNTKYGIFELKLCKNGRFDFSQIREHQVYSLLDCEHYGLYHKIADQTFGANGYGSSIKKPCDCFNLPPTPAYVVIFFYQKRIKKIGYYVRIKEFNKMLHDSAKKSVREEEIEKIAEDVIDLNLPSKKK